MEPFGLSYLASNYNETPSDMKYVLTLTLALISSSFISFGQTAVESSNNTVRNYSTTPTVIQLTSDKDVTVVQSQQNSGSLDITDPDIDGDSLVVKPNPTKGHLSISVPANLIGREIRVIDMTGRFVGNPIPITGTTESLTIEGESGMYLLLIETEEKVITQRIQLATY